MEMGMRKIELRSHLRDKIVHLQSKPIEGFDAETLHNCVEVLKPHMLERLKTKNTRVSVIKNLNE